MRWDSTKSRNLKASLSWMWREQKNFEANLRKRFVSYSRANFLRPCNSFGITTHQCWSSLKKKSANFSTTKKTSIGSIHLSICAEVYNQHITTTVWCTLEFQIKPVQQELYFGYKALHFAIINDDLKTIKLLFDHGAELRIGDQEKKLTFAIFRDIWATLKLSKDYKTNCYLAMVYQEEFVVESKSLSPIQWKFRSFCKR